MGIAEQIYRKTAIGTQGSISVTTGVSVGASGLTYQHYEDFKTVITELEALEAAGLVTIVDRHQETTTGKRYTDIVRFKRLK